MRWVDNIYKTALAAVEQNYTKDNAMGKLMMEY